MFENFRPETVSSGPEHQETEFNKEPGTKERIEVIENSDLELDDKLSLALILLDQKPAMLMDFGKSGEKGEAVQEIFQEVKDKQEEYKELLEKIGMKSRIEPIGSSPFFRVQISKDDKNLEALIKACEESNEKEVGILLGYPQSAVDAFIEAYAKDKFYDIDKSPSLHFREFIDEELSAEERQKIIDSDVLNFIGFAPSRKSWKKEIKRAEEDQLCIKEQAPKLYKEIVDKPNLPREEYKAFYHEKNQDII